MYRMLIVGALLLAGCQGTVGPFQHRQPQRVDDPNIPISEQQRRGRDRLALLVESAGVAPPSGLELPGGNGR
ncbi:MAG: hypothetical protein JO112_14755 [Planctomycetes bacterium]|nr:hypothetical protein [Planctomycetota bacterium]